MNKNIETLQNMINQQLVEFNIIKLIQMDSSQNLPASSINFLRNKKITNLLIGNRFLIREKLGEGQFGQIYKAIDLKNNEYVAVKIIHIWKVNREFNSKKKNLRLRYIEEQDKILRKFQHKNILKWIATYQNKDFKLIVTQFCNQGTLFQMITRHESLELEDAINVLKQLCQGVAAMHMQGVCHRDIKPENIFIHNGNYIIGDFGFSKAAGQDAYLKTNVGTPYTQAPEVETGKYKLNADIYSLGVVFYIMITTGLQIPFRGNQAKNLDLNNFEIYLKSEKKAPPEVILFLKKCLQKDPKNRMTWQKLIDDPIFSLKNESKISNIYSVEINIKQQLQGEEDRLKENSKYISILQSSSSQDKVTIEQPLLDANTSEVNETSFQQLVFEETKENSQKISMSEFIKVLETIQIQKIIQNLVENQETRIYKRLKFFHLNVKLAEFIYKEIIYVIENKKMLDLKKKKFVELMYMLSARCFIYMSYIHDETYRLPFEKFNDEVKQFVKNKIGELYKKCQNNFMKYSNLLKSHEDKFVEMVSLRFKKITSNKQVAAKESIFNGIQKIDYEKKDQIDWIQKELNKISKFQINDEIVCSKMLAKFKAFTKINEITEKDVQNKLFDDLVEQLIYDNI